MPEFINVTKKFDGNAVVESFSLKLKKSSPTVIMGESGCGKTTLLRIAAGLDAADSGSFDTEGENIAYMFQEDRLLPWKSALDNIRAVLPNEHHSLAEKYISLVGLDTETDGKKLPSELSGGMRQRVAFARFLAYTEATNATLLLLDEPFSALDDATAERMINLLSIAAKDKYLLMVSHDEADAIRLGAEVIRLQ